MFFPERITGIAKNDRVLEVGPGSLPHQAASTFLEKKFNSEIEEASQRGNAKKITLSKPVFYINEDGTFPFRDKEFDYVICSHVIEHVADVQLFVDELSRVAKRGYLEYPLIYYDYLYNFDVHVNFVKYNNGVVYWKKKDHFPLDAFRPVQAFFYNSFESQYLKLVDDFKQYFFEGYEWNDRLILKEATSLQDLCHPVDMDIEIPKIVDTNATTGIARADKLIGFIRRIARK